jgi:hypothetical protein
MIITCWYPKFKPYVVFLETTLILIIPRCSHIWIFLILGIILCNQNDNHP